MTNLIDPFSVASETEFTVTGKTYEAKALIKSAGFAWDKENRMWIGDATAKANFEEMGNPARGRADARLVNACKVVPVYLSCNPENCD